MSSASKQDISGHRPILDIPLFRRVDIAALAIFRIAFGAVMLWEVARYLEKNWVREYWIRPEYHFTYAWFDWVKPWHGDGMIIHYYVLAMLSVLIMTGLWYRVATVLMFIGFSYVFLLEQAYYWNHFYLIALVSFLLIFLPAHRAWSLDVSLRKQRRMDSVPAWTVLLLQCQIGIVYFFGGVAKLNYDWLVRAEPMRQWLSNRQGFPLIGQYFTEPWMAHGMTIGGTMIDLLTPFLLLSRRTRPFMMTLLLAFHYMNDRLFVIGIFPWFMIIASTIFFPSDWPRKLAQTIAVEFKKRRARMFIGMIVSTSIGLYLHRSVEIFPLIISALGGAIVVWAFIDAFSDPSNLANAKPAILESSVGKKRMVIGLLVLWTIVQIIVPLRQFFIPGNVSWTEEGHRFSWHMKLRDKIGLARFYAYDPKSKARFEIPIGDLLKKWQYTKMTTRPYMIQQFAQHLHEKLQGAGKGNYEIQVEALASLNSRPYELLVDPNIDLATQTYCDFQHNPWILQMEHANRPDSSTTEPGAGDGEEYP